MNKANFIFFGSAQLSVYYLNNLKKSGITPSVVVTLPPSPYGRGRKLKDNPVQTWAQENKIQCILWKDSNTTLELLKDQSFDFALVFAFGKILKKELIYAPNFQFGFINLHPSLLPLLRGPSPIRSALLHNQKEALGVTYIKMDEKMDHGPIILQKEFSPETWPMPGDKLDRLLIDLGSELFTENLNKLLNGEISYVEQNHELATFTDFFSKSDCEISPDNITKDGIILGQDAFCACACDINPSPFFYKKGKRVKISKLTNISSDQIAIDKVIPEGKKEISWHEFQVN